MVSQNYVLDNGCYFCKERPVLNFNYSDGDEFEKELYNLISSAKDRSLFSVELIKAIKDWPSSCHLSPVRANLLRPIANILNTNILELGAGFGMITRYLGELGGEVFAVEASEIRARTIRERTLELNNVNVICDRIETLKLNKKFDIVTLIGVLQYSRLFSNCEGPLSPEIEILKSSIKHLNTDGMLIISIQNKLGLKYFAGCPEANTGVPFFGVEGHYHPKSIIRFDLEEIKSILNRLGLEIQKILYPFPDYHMAVSILDEQAMRESTNFSAVDIIMASAFRDKVRPDWVQPNFMLESAWETIYSSGLAKSLSNAFLILASKTNKLINQLNDKKEIAWHYSSDRLAEYATGKIFKLNSSNNIEVNPLKLTKKNIERELVSHILEQEPYVKGRIYWSLLIKIIKTPGWLIYDVAVWALKWMKFICRKANLPDDLSRLDLKQEIDGAFYDWTPFNCVIDENHKLHCIDKEWHLKTNIKIIFVFIRGLVGSFLNVTKSYPSEYANITLSQLIILIFKNLNISITQEMINEAFLFDYHCQQVIHQLPSTSLTNKPNYFVEILNDYHMSTMHREVRNRDEEIRAIINLGKQLGSTESQLKIAEEKLQANEKQLGSTELQLQTTEEKLQANEKQLESTESQLQTIEEKLQANEKQLESTESQLQTTKEKLQVNEKQLESTESQLQTTEEKLQANEKQLESTESQLNEAKGLIHTLTNEQEIDKQQLQQLKNELDILNRSLMVKIYRKLKRRV